MPPSFTELLSYLFPSVAQAKLEAFLVEGTTFLVKHIPTKWKESLVSNKE